MFHSNGEMYCKVLFLRKQLLNFFLCTLPTNRRQLFWTFLNSRAGHAHFLGLRAGAFELLDRAFRLALLRSFWALNFGLLRSRSWLFRTFVLLVSFRALGFLSRSWVYMYTLTLALFFLPAFALSFGRKKRRRPPLLNSNSICCSTDSFDSKEYLDNLTQRDEMSSL